MMIDLCLANCKIPPKHDDYYIGVDEGKIVEIRKSPITSEKTIDLEGKIILPGLIDAHVHFRDPGLTYKEDFKTGSQSAANGGFTTVLDMPNTVPPTNTVKAFKEKLDIASKKSVVDFGLHAGVSDLGEIEKIADLKPASFKVFADLVENSFLMDVFKTVANLPQQHIISIHCEDGDITRRCSEELKTNNDPKVYAKARPPIAEVISISVAIALSEYYNQKTHICHVSTKKSLELINQAQINDYPVSCEITPHHLLLSDFYFDKCGNFAKTNPPLRDINNRLDLSYLQLIDIIGTDHAPHSLEEKERGLWEAPPGIPNLETTLPLLLNHVHNGQMTFQEIIRLLCEKPARIFNLTHKGRISVGMDADFVVVDMDRECVLNHENFYSKAEYTPFEGFKVRGTPVMTMVRGNVVMEEGNVFENQGQYVFD